MAATGYCTQSFHYSTSSSTPFILINSTVALLPLAMSAIVPSSSNPSKPRKKTKKKDTGSDGETKRRATRAESTVTDVRAGGEDTNNINTNRAYVSPQGTVLTGDDIGFGEFDYDAVKADKDAEVWLVRVPDGVRTFSL